MSERWERLLLAAIADGEIGVTATLDHALGRTSMRAEQVAVHRAARRLIAAGGASPEGLARIVAARTVHGGCGAEMRTFRKMVREMREDARLLRAEKL